MTTSMIRKQQHQQLEEKKSDLEKKLSDPELLKNQKGYASATREYREVQAVLNAIQEYTKLEQQLKEMDTMNAEESDPELLVLAQDEKIQLQKNF